MHTLILNFWRRRPQGLHRLPAVLLPRVVASTADDALPLAGARPVPARGERPAERGGARRLSDAALAAGDGDDDAAGGGAAEHAVLLSRERAMERTISLSLP